ncbi:MAG: hypothetical protein LBC54_02265 [Bacteroidales bacterium OttesenSCG-928-I14]|jgi:hypothetical protein|nr:hypothetical protein [Bacteroidales bacterium OttesenSCG-928-I14]
MTEKEEKLLFVLESHIHRLMFLYDDLKIKMNDIQLLCNKLENENKILKNKYDNLKIAQIISMKHDDFKCTKAKFEQLIKKIDNCIASLNE